MHAGDLAQLDYLRNLARQLADAGHGERGPLLDAAQQTLGLSRQRIYARLADIGWSSGRKLRADAGASSATDAEVRAVSSIIHASHRQTGKRLLSIADGMAIARKNGLLAAPVSPSRMATLMRRLGCHPEQLAQPTPHVELRTEHPNQVWQLDASLCVLYYAPRTRGLCVMEQSEFYAKKPVKLESVRNQRLLRYMVTDHYSGAIHARYYAAQGEDQATLVEFLVEAFSHRDGFVMHGVPWQFVWDAGSANTAAGVQAMLKALTVQQWPHRPGNPRAKGQVECSHNILERRFEGRLAFMRIESVEQLNAELDVWLKATNGRAKHSRHGHTRWGLWQTIRPEQLRLAPPEHVLRSAVTSRPEPRKVDGRLCIRYAIDGHGSLTYSVKHVPDVRVGDTLQIVRNLYAERTVHVIHQPLAGPEQYIECQPIERDAAGFDVNAPVIGRDYRAAPDTTADAERKTADSAAWGATNDRDIKRARKAGAVAFNGKLDAMADLREAAASVPAHLPRRGTDIDMPTVATVEARPLSHVEALMALRDQLGRPIEPHESARIARLYPDGVPESELATLATRLTSAPALSVVGG